MKKQKTVRELDQENFAKETSWKAIFPFFYDVASKENVIAAFDLLHDIQQVMSNLEITTIVRNFQHGYFDSYREHFKLDEKIQDFEIYKKVINEIQNICKDIGQLRTQWNDILEKIIQNEKAVGDKDERYDERKKFQQLASKQYERVIGLLKQVKEFHKQYYPENKSLEKVLDQIPGYDENKKKSELDNKLQNIPKTKFKVEITKRKNVDGLAIPFSAKIQGKLLDSVIDLFRLAFQDLVAQDKKDLTKNLVWTALKKESEEEVEKVKKEQPQNTTKEASARTDFFHHASSSEKKAAKPLLLNLLNIEQSDPSFKIVHDTWHEKLGQCAQYMPSNVMSQKKFQALMLLSIYSVSLKDEISYKEYLKNYEKFDSGISFVPSNDLVYFIKNPVTAESKIAQLN